MSPSPAARPEEFEPPPGELVEAGIYPTAKEGFDHGLVVLAMGQPYWLVPGEAGHRLLVEPEKLSEVRAQLAQFDRESAHWPPTPLADPEARGQTLDLFAPMLWSAVLVVTFWAQHRWPQLVARFGLDANAVVTQGEIWRAATALFLHANAEHLLSNVLGGTFVVCALSSTFGRKRGWLLLAVASVLANMAVAGLHFPAAYRSIGASTAVFAGVGLLTGRALRVVARARRAPFWREIFLPFASGFTVLALYGAGGPNVGAAVDVGAHTAGFFAGLGAGFAFGVPRLRTPRAVTATDSE